MSGGPPEDPPAGQEHVATVVVSDLKGSTALAERLDPESLREVLRRYFAEMRTVLEAYGGRIEKVIGDAIVCSFGLDEPDDDHGAAAAVEAVDEARAALETLNDQLEGRWGVRLVNRTGVATGQVLVGEAAGDRVITGAAIDTATRLEQASPPLGALLAESTLAEVGDGVRVEAAGAVEVRNVPAPVPAHRLEEVVVRRARSDRGPAAGEGADGPRETRRTVTIVFADARVVPGVTPSPAALRDSMSRYFAVVREILERHGGTVEKYIGDAVMAVYGLERRREDDADRAVRAAIEMRDALAGVNAALALAGAPELEQRIGVNTGNLVASAGADRQRLVTGDAVNVAARLEQNAAPGEVLVGGPTADLTHSVRLEEIEPLALKGKSKPVRAYRALDARATRVRAEARTPLVGREEELGALVAGMDAALAARHAWLTVLLGDAGVGKSRLVAEFAARASEHGALVLSGQCLAYGEGITFWPIVEIIHEAAGITADDDAAAARARLAGLPGSEPDVEERLASLIGLSDTPYPLSELFWATRRALFRMAEQRPLFVHVEDMHHAEPTLVELLAHLSEIYDATVLIVATGREDTRDRHPELIEAAGEDVRTLSPLSPEHAAAVVANVLGHGTLPEAVRARVVQASAGNPLFVEQLLSMLVDSGRLTRVDGRWRLHGDPADLAIPPSIEALVAARVDELPEDQRSTLEPAAVIGGEFSTQAVSALTPPAVGPRVPALLEGLGERQMVAPLPEPDGAFDHRFAHPMIRDVTYEGLLKRERADLHERFVAWVEEAQVAGDRAVELEEVLGYHLEQAYRYRSELGPLDAAGHELGRRAAARLAPAGRRALERGDMPAAANLLRRAATVLPEDDVEAARLLVRAGQAEIETGRFTDADETLERAARRAHGIGQGDLASLARLERTRLSYTTGRGPSDDDAAAQAEGAIYAFTASGDDEGLAVAWRLLTNVRLTGSRLKTAEEAALATRRHALAAGDHLLATRMQLVLAQLGLHGPTPVYEAIGRCREILDEVEGDRQEAAIVRRALAHLRAMRGEITAAREECRRCRADLEELGWVMDAALVSMDSGPIELMADDPVAAEAELRRDVETLDAMGERNFIATTAALLSEALYRQDRFEEAQETIDFSRGIATEGDATTHTVLYAVQGKLLARTGDVEGAVATAQRAVDLASETDEVVSQGDALVDLAEVLLLTGERRAAHTVLAQAADRYRTKGNLVALWRVSRLMEATRGRR